MTQYNIAIAGTGYVGLSIATLLAQHNRYDPVLDDAVAKVYTRDIFKRD